MSSDPARKPARARRDGGFTLVEILVSLVIVTIFATILFQLVRGQGSFVAAQGGRSEAQQNARGALEIIGADLRVASPQALVEGRSNALTLNVPRAWGVVCTATATQIVAVFPVVAGTMATTVNANTGLTVDENPAQNVAAFRSAGTLSAMAAIDTAGSGCSARGVVQAYRFTGTDFPAGQVGEVMFVHDRITYDVATGTDNLLWIRRTHGGDQQPLAGPLVNATDLRFTYLDMTPAVVTAPGTDATNLRAVGRIRVDVATRSRHQVNGMFQTERDSITISLRN